MLFVCRWIDSVFIPAVNRAGSDGWDMVKVATDIKLAAEAAGREVGAAWPHSPAFSATECGVQ